MVEVAVGGNGSVMENPTDRDELGRANAQLQELYQLHGQSLFDHLLFLVGNRVDALDLFQETFASCLVFLRRGGTVREPHALLRRCASRLAIRFLQRRRWRRQRDTYLPEPVPACDHKQHEACSLLRALWARLDSKGKVVLKGLLLDEMTMDEIVEYSGLSASTVSRRVRQVTALIEEVNGSKEKRHEND